jgi:hypothetical protein
MECLAINANGSCLLTILALVLHRHTNDCIAWGVSLNHIEQLSEQKLAADLQALKAIALTKGYCNELIEGLQRSTVGYATTTIELSLECAFRARKLDGNFEPHNASQFWHPEPFQVTRFGRANLPYQPMLYCSDGLITAINEVNGTAGDRIAVIEMELTDDHHGPKVFSLGELRHRYRTRTKIHGAQRDTVLHRMRDMGIDTKLALQIDGFLADVFRHPGDDLYPLTTAITQFLISPEIIDGVVYPAVSGGRGANLALKPPSAQRLLSLRRAKIVRLIAPHGGTFMARDELISERIEPDGRITWLRAPVRALGT